MHLRDRPLPVPLPVQNLQLHLGHRVALLLAIQIQEEFHRDLVVLPKGSTIVSVVPDFNDVPVGNGPISNRLPLVLNAVLE